LRFILADHPRQSPASRRLFERVVRGSECVRLPEVALCDVVWTLSSFYKRPKAEIRQFVLDVLAVDGVQMERKAIARNALELFATKNVDFSDAMIASEMLNNGESEICSFDRDFDRVGGVKRMEP
jgi:predicted nucleic-acid-binding protein